MHYLVPCTLHAHAHAHANNKHPHSCMPPICIDNADLMLHLGNPRSIAYILCMLRLIGNLESSKQTVMITKRNQSQLHAGKTLSCDNPLAIPRHPSHHTPPSAQRAIRVSCVTRALDDNSRCAIVLGSKLAATTPADAKQKPPGVSRRC
jgi:hypothetical protein